MPTYYAYDPKNCNHLHDGEEATVDLDDENEQCMKCGAILTKREPDPERDPIDSDENLGTGKGSGSY